MAKNKVFLRTFGCQMNVRDSEVIKGLLLAEGYSLVDDAKEADVVLFNTCSVREHAEHRVWSIIGLLSRKRNRPLIGLMGCMAQNYKDEVLKKAPGVDIVCGPSEIDNIALYLEEALRTEESVIAVSEKNRREDIYHTGFHEKKDHAYIVISEGCDNFCTYCVVPYVRGRLRHRSYAEIIKEAEGLIKCGIKNVTLLGQNVNSYMSEIDFIGLLNKVSAVAGLESLSFITCHPKDTTIELFEVMRDIDIIKKSLHMPIQSGSDKILQAMNRGYTAKKYFQLIDRYRSLVYNGLVSTDIIVGFPGESEEDFKATKKAVEEIRFDAAYIFKYSPRPNTSASGMPDDVPIEVKERRHAELLSLQKEISKSKSKSRDKK